MPRRGDPGALSLGEGRTPLVPSQRLAKRLGISRLFFKVEGANPTGSYKDRYVAATMNAALPFGIRRVVVSSTGNAGVSVAAYAAAAGIPCLFLAASGLPSAALREAQAYGSIVVMTDPEQRQVLLEHAALRGEWFPIGLRMPRRVCNPFGVEGYRTLGEELIAELGDEIGAVLFPVARGNGLYGTWLAFRDRSGSSSRMIACQPDTANSVEVSLRDGLEVPRELPPSSSIAFSTRERQADVMTLRAIRESGGAAVSVSDGEIMQAQADLAREGLFVEPSCALTVACLPGLVAGGKIGPDETIVCVLTAGGIRWTEHLPPCPQVPTIPPSPEALDAFLAQAGHG